MKLSELDVVLASKSPRRIELLSALIPKFRVQPSAKEERCNCVKPSYLVKQLAAAKGEGVSGELVIAADTIVYLKGVYGKPKDAAAAVEMLKSLQGKWHTVYTGVYLNYKGRVQKFYCKSKVLFNKLDECQITKYVHDYSPLDKAGSYGIQDKIIVAKYSGSYSNIVGLPMEMLKKALKDYEIEV